MYYGSTEKKALLLLMMMMMMMIMKHVSAMWVERGRLCPGVSCTPKNIVSDVGPASENIATLFVIKFFDFR